MHKNVHDPDNSDNDNNTVDGNFALMLCNGDIPDALAVLRCEWEML